MNGKKIAAWTGGAIAALMLLSVSGALLIQRNTFVHRYLLAKMIQIGEKSSGTEITIRDYAIRWLPLQIRLQGVTVRGRERNFARPLAEVPEIEIGIAWDALLHKRVDLTELILDRPAINIAVDQAGRSNLPAWPASTSAPSTSKMQVSIEHAAVRNGEFRYNDSPRKVDADLADFHLDVRGDATGERYSGNLGYSKGEITIDGYLAVHHDTDISFAATTAGVTFEKIHISTEQSQLNATGIVRGYANPAVEGQYEAHLSIAELHEQLPGSPLSGGEIELTGSLSYKAAAGPGLKALKTNGHVSSRTLRAAVSTFMSRAEVNLRSLAGDYSLEGGSLHVTALRAETMGGIVRAELSAESLTATPSYQVSVSAESLSLGEIGQAAGAAAAPLRGTARIQASAHWISSIRNMVAHADARISAAINPAQDSVAPANAAPLPVNADLHLAYDAPHSLLAVTKSTFSSNQTSIVAAGTISDHSALSVCGNTSDLHETDLLVAAARGILSAMGKTASSATTPLNLQGRASLEAQIQGRIQDPRITGHAEADALEIRQAHWPHMQADFDVTASSVSLKKGFAESANHGQMNFTFSTSLQHWSYTANNPVALQLQASQIPAADLEQLTGALAPISGMFSGNLSVRGTIDNPAGEGTVELRNASLWGEPVRSIAAQVRAADKTFSAHFSAAAEAGNISGEGEFGGSDRHYQISISHSAVNLGQIRYLSSRGYAIAGILGIDAHGQGTLGAPQLEIIVTGDQLTFRTAPLGSLRATAQVANQQINFAVTSTIAGGQINASGNAGLAAPYMVHGGFEIRSLEFGPLLATYLPSARKQLEGTTEVRGEIEGPLAHPQEVKASVDLSNLHLTYQDLTLASAGPIRLNYVDSALTISQAELKGTGTDFKLSGTLPLRGSAPLNISTTGQIDLKLLTILGSNTRSSGTVKIDVAARGALKQPQVGGTIELAGASFASDVAPIGVENVDARIAVANNRLTIETFSGKMSGGSFSASGFASYSPASFSLQVNGKSVRVRYPEGTRAQLDTNLTLMGTPAASTLNGRVTIAGLSFTPDFDLANFIGQFTSSTPAAPSKWEENMRLDVAVASSQDLALSSSKLSLQGSANLRVAGTLANPVVLGRTILSGGELFFMGNRYQVQSGTVVFANPVRTEPTLNLYVATVVQQYNITLNFLGPLDRLRTNYTSDPALPPVDIIHLLAFGKTSEESAATARPAALGAESVIANRLTSQLSGRIEKLAGISQLQIDPSLGGNNSNPGARVAIQQRLTSTILFTFATDLTDTQNAVAQVKYQTRGRLSFSLTRDEYGSFAIEAKIRKKF
jgi:translocation and assembly module TamB